MATRRNMIIIVASKSNKSIDLSHQHTIKDSLTLSLKTKSIVELYAQTKLTLKVTSTLDVRGARKLTQKLKP